MRIGLVAAVAACLVGADPASAQTAAPTRAQGEALMEQALAAETDPVAARRLMEQAAASGYPEALNGLAVYLDNGVGGPVDLERARALMEQAARAGSSSAKLNLGIRLQGSQADEDRARAFVLLEEAAKDERLAPSAAPGLGKAYIFGWGVPQDIRRGVDILEAAAERAWDEPDAQYLLGRTYQSGWGGRTVDPAKSFKHFHRAAELGSARAAWLTGMRLLRGDGVARDAREAYRWVRRAAELGEIDGQISTAVMLATGEGVAENDREAREWYVKAAERNSAHALRGLGFMLAAGEGGPAEPARGRAYVELAAEAGDVNATRGLNDGLLPSADRAEIDRFKAEWIAVRGKPTKVE